MNVLGIGITGIGLAYGIYYVYSYWRGRKVQPLAVNPLVRSPSIQNFDDPDDPGLWYLRDPKKFK